LEGDLSKERKRKTSTFKLIKVLPLNKCRSELKACCIIIDSGYLQDAEQRRVEKNVWAGAFSTLPGGSLKKKKEGNGVDNPAS